MGAEGVVGDHGEELEVVNLSTVALQVVEELQLVKNLVEDS